MRNRDCLVVLHFNPIEAYPPVMNALDYFISHCSHKKIVVVTTRPAGDMDVYTPGRGDCEVIIIRYPAIESNVSMIKSWVRYFRFYYGALYQLRRFKPSAVLYYETISSLPGLLYKKFFDRSVKLLAHYHEYMSIDEVQNGSRLNRLCSRFEKKNFRLVNSFSHTNGVRLNFFKRDYGISSDNSMVLPNYPPSSWKNFARSANSSGKDFLKVVYTGYGLDTKSMFVTEFFTWVHKQQGAIRVDCYVRNLEPSVKDFLETLASPWISIFSWITYSDLPKTLCNYDVGVILYKGHIPNFVHNAPNKLFEYMACALDVWYPTVMEGIKEYTSMESRPKVIPVDFEKLDLFKWRETLSDTHSFRANSFYSDSVYSGLLEKVFSKE